MKMQVSLWMRVLPIYLIMGSLVYAPVAVQNIRVADAVAVAAKTEQSLNTKTIPELVAGKPIAMTIPRLGINLRVIDGIYDKKTGWNVSAVNAQYAVPTQAPNNKTGKTIIYGHDTRIVFQPTESLEVGDIVYINTDNGLTFSYQYVNDEIVLPNNTTVFNSTDSGEPRLVLITCSGKYFNTRRIMNFSYRGVAK